MIWYGIEPAVVRASRRRPSRSPFRRRCRPCAGSSRAGSPRRSSKAPAQSMISSPRHSGTTDTREDILRGLSEALKGFSQMAKPRAWDDFAKAARPPAGRSRARSLARLRQRPRRGRARRAHQGFRRRRERAPQRPAVAAAQPEAGAFPNRAQPDQRQGSRHGGAPRLREVRRGRCARKPCSPSGRAARRWRAANVTALSSRAAWATQLLAFVEKHPAAREDISPFQARQLRNLGDEALSQQLTKVWGELRETPGRPEAGARPVAIAPHACRPRKSRCRPKASSSSPASAPPATNSTAKAPPSPRTSPAATGATWATFSKTSSIPAPSYRRITASA